jgi:hypothetical protein
MIVERIRVSVSWLLSISVPIRKSQLFIHSTLNVIGRAANFIFNAYVIAGESGESRGVLALLIDVVSAFLVAVGDGLGLFSAAALTIVDGSADARLFFECRFS